MALSNVNGLSICGIVTTMPNNTEDNLNLSFITEDERAQLVKHTGIRFRRVVSEQTSIKSYFAKGITQLLVNLSWDLSDVDAIICVTQSQTTNIPALSCQLHGDLRFSPSTLCFDMNLGCSGYVYGIQIIGSILTSIDKKNPKAILCCGDFSSTLIDKTDKATVPIFSDAVSVTGIELNANNGTSYFNLETEGSGQQAIYTENNVMRLNGIDVFNYSLKTVPLNIKTLLNFSQKNEGDIDAYVFHQANKLINDAIGKRLAIAESKCPSSLFEFGNTASASIPLTLGLYNQQNKCSQVLLCGFGVGFSVGSGIVPLSESFIFQNIML